MAERQSPTLFDAPAKGSNTPEFTVSELSQQVKREIETTFGQVRVRGEVSQLKVHSSGHVYLSLKDESAVLAAVCWKGQAGRLKVRMEEGMEVVATGRLTTYPGQSKYQLVIEQVALAGLGALLKMLEERKKKLAAEGLFDDAHKKALPYLPRVIGVVTSPTGAVIQDILHRLAERFPVRVLLWPVNVQGENAAAQIAGAITGFNALFNSAIPSASAADAGDATGRAHLGVPIPDLLIVARGGGSVEDLLPFSEEIVVRAAANSRIPLISAVGHETDTTLIDFAADKRAPTPTAAAEMAVPVRADLLAFVAELALRLLRAGIRFFEMRKRDLQHSAARLVHPRALIEQLAQRLDERITRLQLGMHNQLQRRTQFVARLSAGLSVLPFKQMIAHGVQRVQTAQQRLQLAMRQRIEKQGLALRHLSGLLANLSYQSVLARGFAMVKGTDGAPITRAADLATGQDAQLVFHDGEKKVHVERN